MSLPIARPHKTAEEYTAAEEKYLEAEAVSIEKHEFVDGEIVAMAGASFTHNRVDATLRFTTHSRLRGKGRDENGTFCTEYGGDLRVLVHETGNYYYPDMTIVCGTPEIVKRKGLDCLVNPVVIFEIISESTELKDRGEKFAQYRRIPTLMEYVLVAQDRILAEVYARQDDGSWKLHIYEQRADSLALSSVEIALPLAEIYEDMDVPEGYLFPPQLRVV